LTGRGPRTLLSAAAVVLIATVGRTPIAHAEFGPIELVSKSAKEQAAEATNPVISADGRYVAFAGRIGGHEGVFRKDRQTGAILPVVVFEGGFPGEAARFAMPSISADGRYVAFDTKEPLDPAEDQNEQSDVYVADMGSGSPTYELASAKNGSDEAFEGVSKSAGGVAMSEDGRRLAFVSEGQVYVRDLGTTRTVLITVRMGGSGEEPILRGGADGSSEGAAISGDGSTVAWVGSDLPEQVPMLNEEVEVLRALESRPESEPESGQYHEPLWRRVPSPLEPDPPTRRVVGGGDPLAPGCPAGGTIAEPACQGPFPDLTGGRQEDERIHQGSGWGLGTPHLDRDGYTVAFVGNPDEDGDLYVVDMAPGLTRRQAVRRLTQWVNPIPGALSQGAPFEAKYTGFSGPVQECAISPDGNRIAFTSARQVFPFSPPTLVTPPPPGVSGAVELYQVDLTGQTIERVTPGSGGAVSLLTEGGNGTAGATAPSYSDEGRFLAFASSAYNLVPGDTNENSDAFVVESPPPAPVEPTKISPRPAALVVKPLWRMTVSTASLPDGRVRIVVGVPGSGAVHVMATARLGSHRKLRRVAAAHRYASAPGTQKLVLRLSGKRRGLARKKGGLYAQLDVGFVGPGGKPLKAALDARFLVHRRKVKGK
jgi:Tol biopolymer transport system component